MRKKIATPILQYSEEYNNATQLDDLMIVSGVKNNLITLLLCDRLEDKHYAFTFKDLEMAKIFIDTISGAVAYLENKKLN